MTAGEIVERLASDPEYQKKMREKEAQWALKRAAIKEIEKDFISDLHANGFIEISDTDDLLQIKKASPKLVGLLLQWLSKMDNRHQSKEWLVRSLMRAAKPFDGRTLMALFDDPASSSDLKWAIGNTIAGTRVENVKEWVREKMVSSGQGKENQMLVYALIRYYDYTEARDMLIKVFERYPLQVADALATIGKAQDLSFLEEQLADYKGPGLGEIKKGIKKLEKRLAK